MALPTQAQIVTMNFAGRGLPYIRVVAKSGIDIQTMNYASRGLPFVGNNFGTVASWSIFGDEAMVA